MRNKRAGTSQATGRGRIFDNQVSYNHRKRLDRVNGHHRYRIHAERGNWPKLFGKWRNNISASSSVPSSVWGK